MSDNFVGVFFDFFGTLIDSRHSLTTIWSRIAKRLGKEIKPSDPRIWQGIQKGNQAANRMNKFFGDFTIEQRLELNSIVLDAMGVYKEESAEIIAEEFKQEFTSGSNFCLYPNCKTTLEQIQSLDLKIGLITHASRSLCKSSLERLEIIEYFDTFILSEDSGYNKSQIEIYRIALEAMSADNPEKVMHVGDDLFLDVQMAQEVGMTPILFDPYNLHEIEDVITIPDLSEVLQYLL